MTTTLTQAQTNALNHLLTTPTIKTTYKEFIEEQAYLIYSTQFDQFNVALPASPVAIDEGAYMLVNYSIDDWILVEWDHAKVSSKIATARYNQNKILYKDWFTTNAASLKPTLDVSTLLTYDNVKSDAPTNTYTVHEL